MQLLNNFKYLLRFFHLFLALCLCFFVAVTNAQSQLTEKQLAAIFMILQSGQASSELPDGVASIQTDGLPTPDAIVRIELEDGTNLLVEPNVTYFDDGEASGYIEFADFGLPQRIVFTTGESMNIEWFADGRADIRFTDANGSVAIFSSDTELDLSAFFSNASSQTALSQPLYSQQFKSAGFSNLSATKNVSVQVVGCANDVPIESAEVWVEKQCSNQDSFCPGLGHSSKVRATHVGNGEYQAKFTIPDPALKFNCGSLKPFQNEIKEFCLVYGYATGGPVGISGTVMASAMGAAAAGSGVALLVASAPIILAAATVGVLAAEFTCNVADFCSAGESLANFVYDDSVSNKRWKAFVTANGATFPSQELESPVDTSPLNLVVDIGPNAVVKSFTLNPEKPDYDEPYTANIELFCAKDWHLNLIQASSDQSGRDTENFIVENVDASYSFKRSAGTPRKTDVWDLVLTPPAVDGLSSINPKLVRQWELPFHDLRIDVTGSGKIESEHVDCRDSFDNCFEEDIEYGKIATLVPFPDLGEELISWGGACEGTNVDSDCEVEMTSDLIATAEFTEDLFQDVCIDRGGRIYTFTSPNDVYSPNGFQNDLVGQISENQIYIKYWHSAGLARYLAVIDLTVDSNDQITGTETYCKTFNGTSCQVAPTVTILEAGTFVFCS
ncbi:hypothetical protein [Paraglaciecola arctica]|uniref:hypothetical protein n=1 Tax=Paraglaciecola arctica TaxID=1128911 RepID=UPI001C06606B|nr:hypothetical protein [Paraglaciecola arctica]MBU3004226.1 hypothetical protein [Paraglaciecola arctica]